MSSQPNNGKVNDSNAASSNEGSSKNTTNDSAKKRGQEAFKIAERDMEKDPELSAHSPNDDLDEGESARLGENTGLI